MRTTLNLDDDIYREVKIVAAQRGVSTTSVIEDALRAAILAHSDHTRPDFPVSTRSGGMRSTVDLNSSDELYDLLYGDDDRRATAWALG